MNAVFYVKDSRSLMTLDNSFVETNNLWCNLQETVSLCSIRFFKVHCKTYKAVHFIDKIYIRDYDRKRPCIDTISGYLLNIGSWI